MTQHRHRLTPGSAEGGQFDGPARSSPHLTCKPSTQTTWRNALELPTTKPPLYANLRIISYPLH
jgi:hypothetical protein